MTDDPNSWEPEIAELRRRQALGRAMGGPKKLERQRRNDRLNVRERIETRVGPKLQGEYGVGLGVVSDRSLFIKSSIEDSRGTGSRPGDTRPATGP